MSQWRLLRARLKKPDFGSSQILLGLDFDGTLADIVERPEHAALSERTRTLLTALAGRGDVRLAVLSGRALDDVKKLVGVPGIFYGGDHGLQLEGPDFKWTHPLATGLDAAFWRRLQEDLGDIPGALLERKRLGAAVHYRAVPRRYWRRLASRVRARLAGLRDRYRILRGKKTLDIRPTVSWDKGRALDAIRNRLPGGWLGIFVGDDVTDEEGFRSLGPRALTIRVGRVRETNAQFVLSHRGLVDRLLQSLVER